MCRVIGDAKLLLDQSRYAATGPNGSAKAKGFGTLGQQSHELATLLNIKQRWSARSRPLNKSCLAMQVSPFEPLAHCALRHTQSFGDLGLLPAFAVQLPSTLAATLTPTTRLVGMWCAHMPSIPHIRPSIISYLCTGQ